jgi:type IV secretory pathway TraG/TraD family ATPase VirD4
LQQFYTPIYARSAAGSAFNGSHKYQLLYAAGVSTAAELASESDVKDGATLASGGQHIPLAISAAAEARGLDVLYRGPEQKYIDSHLHTYLQNAVYGGDRLSDIYQLPLLFGFLSLLAQLPFSIRKDIRRRKELKYGRRLKGPVLLTPRQFNKTVSGDGIGFVTTEAKEMMRIPLEAESQHIELMGDTGAGKTTLIMQLLRQIQSRGHAAIVYDPACEFIQRFYDKKREDVVLNPLDERCPYWGPSEELRRRAEAKAIAASLYQPTSDKKGEFFTETPQKIFAHLLTYGPNPQQLVEWLSKPAEIDQRVKDTEMEAMIAKGAQQQRNGVLASLGLVADSLRMLPTKEQAKNKTWSATEWAVTRKGWIFITSSPTEREALRPLHSLWIDLLVMRLLTAPQDQQTPVWFVLDELASLQRLPQLHTAITENRKSKNPLVLGFQGKAQLEVIYGHIAEVMLSQPATKIFLKTTEPKAAEWVSNAIGKVEIERMKETHFDGSRSGKNFAVDRQIEPLVMDSEISGLENRHAFLKLGNNVARFHFEYMDVPQTTPAFLPRKVEDDELRFDPLTLVPKASPEVKPSLDLEAAVPPSPEAQTTAAPVEPKAAVVTNDEDKKEPHEPTEPEVAASAPDPDGPKDRHDEDIPVAEPQPMRI